MAGTTSSDDCTDRTTSIVSALCGAENDRIVLRFDGPISVPTSKYDGRTRTTDTIPYATINATVQHASIEDAGETLLCFVAVNAEEIDRLGVDPELVYTEPVDDVPVHWMLDVHASRELFTAAPEEYDLTMEEAGAAVAAGRGEEVLPPWDGLPTATTRVERTQDCLQRSMESGYHVQYSPPSHELGELIDVRVR